MVLGERRNPEQTREQQVEELFRSINIDVKHEYPDKTSLSIVWAEGDVREDPANAGIIDKALQGDGPSLEKLKQLVIDKLPKASEGLPK